MDDEAEDVGQDIEVEFVDSIAEWPAPMQAAYQLVEAQHVKGFDMPAGLMKAAAHALQRWLEITVEAMERSIAPRKDD